MATLADGPRLNARTTRRIHLGIKRSGLMMTFRGLRFMGRDVTSESIISAVLSAYLDLTEEQQEKFLRDAFPKLEEEVRSVIDKPKK